MIIIWHTHAVLPVVCVSVSQLIVLATWLIGYVIHALEMSDHLVLLEANGDQL